VSLDYPLTQEMPEQAKAAGDAAGLPGFLRGRHCCCPAAARGQSFDGLTVNARGCVVQSIDSVHRDRPRVRVDGGVDSKVLADILEQAETRICPVWVMLKASTPITASFRLNGLGVV